MKILPSFFNKMKFFKRKDKSKDEHLGYSPAFPGSGGSNGYNARRHPSLGSPPHDPFIKQDSLARRPSQFRPMATRSSPSLLLNLPAGVLARIFSFVCLHANDETYETCEQSSLEDACMLCDLRDLAHCTSVCRTWRKVALRTLYVYSFFLSAAYLFWPYFGLLLLFLISLFCYFWVFFALLFFFTARSFEGKS